MKKFLMRLSLFISFFITAILALILVVIFFMKNENYFKISRDTNLIFLGHSQTECGINDSLVKNSRNFSQGGEAYFYTYLKLKMLINANPQIKNVVISFSNNQIDETMNEWVWGDKQMYNYFPKYSFMAEHEDYIVLAKNNLKTFLNAEIKTVKNGLTFLSKKGNNYLKDRNWGGYLYEKENKIDSLLNTDFLKSSKKAQISIISEINICYLKKIVHFCNEKKIKLTFIRMPVHSLEPFRANEKQFLKFKDDNFKEISFYDFINYPISKEEFRDFGHLNYKGARKFSLYLNDFFKKKI